MQIEAETTRMRVESCLTVLGDVSRRLSSEEVSPQIIQQLDHLGDLLSLLDEMPMTVHDLERIEGCTNELLTELGQLFVHQGLGRLYEGASVH